MLSPTASQFVLVTSAASCTAAGYFAIDTGLADCGIAATSLSLPATTAVGDGQTSYTHDPPYCYFESGLKYNADGSNTGACSMTDQCVCRKTTPTAAPYTPGAPSASPRAPAPSAAPTAQPTSWW
eukprot:gene12814-biopygen10347